MYEEINSLIKRYPILIDNENDIVKAYEVIKKSFKNKKKVLVCGNGGSASDSGHICGELMKSFKIKRPIPDDIIKKINDIDLEKGGKISNELEMPLETISLTEHTALMTAIINDIDSSNIFAQQVLGYGKEGDVFWGISTSGNSIDVINAAIVAKAMGLYVITLTGNGGGELKNFSDVVIDVHETETYTIQELHIPIYHCLCIMLENYFFGLNV